MLLCFIITEVFWQGFGLDITGFPLFFPLDSCKQAVLKTAVWLFLYWFAQKWIQGGWKWQ